LKHSVFAYGAVIAALGLLTVPAIASVTDRPFFRVGSVVIVWSADDFIEENWEAPIAHDFVLLRSIRFPMAIAAVGPFRYLAKLLAGHSTMTHLFRCWTLMTATQPLVWMGIQILICSATKRDLPGFS